MPVTALDAKQLRQQRLRLRRLNLGIAAYALMTGMVVVMWWMDYVRGSDLAAYGVWLAGWQLIFQWLVRSGHNLRLPDPSLTTANVLLPTLGSLYLMFQVEAAQMRVPFLLMGAVGLMFATFSNNTPTMARTAACIAAYYAAVIVALRVWAPQRIDLAQELVVLFSYSLVLMQIVLIGHYITGLRAKVIKRNQELKLAAERLKELATRDPLTRLPNRRAAFEQLHAECARHRRQRPAMDKQPLCVALLDVDHFKQINDQHGHLAGDACLRAIGAALQADLRTHDFVARYGGEEFLLALPTTSLTDAEAVCERIRRRVETLEGDALAMLKRPMSISIGLTLHQRGERLEQTLARADAALYRAKRCGRNRLEKDDASTLASVEPRPRLAS